MHFKITTFIVFLLVSSNYIVADEWPEKECNKLSGYVGLVSAASAGSLEEATEAKKEETKKAEPKAEAKKEEPKKAEPKAEAKKEEPKK